MRQTTLTHFASAALDEVSSSGESEYSESEETGKQVSTFWTRVLSRTHMSRQRFATYEIGSDQLFFKALRSTVPPADMQNWELLFDPQQQKRLKRNWSTQDFTLSHEHLELYAKMASAIRLRFEHRAVRQLHEERQGHDSQLAQLRIDRLIANRRFSRSKAEAEHDETTQGVESGCAFNRAKKRKRKEFTTVQLLDMIQFSKSTKRSHKEVAAHFKVSETLISNLMLKKTVRKGYFRKRQDAETKKRERQDQIEQAIVSRISDNVDIWTANEIATQVEKLHSWKPTINQVAIVLKRDFGMRYSRVKKIPYQGNSQRSLVLRQQYALTMLRRLSENQRIINIDETWLNQTDYRRRKWRFKGTANSVPTKQLPKRVSMIAAMDSEGELYISLTQVNTDSSMMSLFLYHLTKVLSQENRNWKQSTLFLLDGAPYHVSSEIHETMKRLGLQVIISAPYSYQTAPVELFFAYLKRDNLIIPESTANKKQVWKPE